MEGGREGEKEKEMENELFSAFLPWAPGLGVSNAES